MNLINTSNSAAGPFSNLQKWTWTKTAPSAQVGQVNALFICSGYYFRKFIISRIDEPPKFQVRYDFIKPKPPKARPKLGLPGQAGHPCTKGGIDASLKLEVVGTHPDQ